VVHLFFFFKIHILVCMLLRSRPRYLKPFTFSRLAMLNSTACRPETRAALFGEISPKWSSEKSPARCLAALGEMVKCTPLYATQPTSSLLLMVMDKLAKLDHGVLPPALWVHGERGAGVTTLLKQIVQVTQHVLPEVVPMYVSLADLGPSACLGQVLALKFRAGAEETDLTSQMRQVADRLRSSKQTLFIVVDDVEHATPLQVVALKMLRDPAFPATLIASTSNAATMFDSKWKTAANADANFDPNIYYSMLPNAANTNTNTDANTDADAILWQCLPVSDVGDPGPLRTHKDLFGYLCARGVTYDWIVPFAGGVVGRQLDVARFFVSYSCIHSNSPSYLSPPLKVNIRALFMLYACQPANIRDAAVKLTMKHVHAVVALGPQRSKLYFRLMDKFCMNLLSGDYAWWKNAGFCLSRAVFEGAIPDVSPILGWDAFHIYCDCVPGSASIARHELLDAFGRDLVALYDAGLLSIEWSPERHGRYAWTFMSVVQAKVHPSLLIGLVGLVPPNEA
jgi:hypothetical protein